MANKDWPHGFIPVGALTGGDAGYIRNYDKVVGYATPVGFYDPVVLVTAAHTFQKYVAGAQITGISLAYSAASKAAVHPILILNSQSIIEGQTDLSLVSADESLNANFNTAASCNAYTGISISEIDSTTEAGTNTLDLHLLRLAPYIDNESGTNSRWFCVPNNLMFVNQVAGI